MKLTFEGRAVWARSPSMLADLGIHFACTGSVRIEGFTYYIVSGYHDIHQRLLETPELTLGRDWLKIPRD